MTRTLAVAFAVLVPAVAAAQDPTGGGWRGRWESDPTGHSGPIRATVAAAGPDAYRATFRGRFWVVFPFRYAVTLNVVGADGERVYLGGDQRVPLFGTFHYTAVADDRTFRLEYQSRRDYGRFTLAR
jgi:hypothetical protein